ncbi:hypothetical protein V6N13_057247 [Hibiscus sabdariffa]
MPGSGSAHLLTPFEALFSVRFSFRMCRSASRVYKPFSFQCSPFESSVGAFILLIREKTSNWEGDPPGELTVPQTDTGEQVEYTRALERTMSKELGKMTPAGQLSWYGRTVAPPEILLYTSSQTRFLNRTSIGERCKHREANEAETKRDGESERANAPFSSTLRGRRS